ncbi:taurine catabolism dioxygenase [Dacryopinax primogenitus]|uniref:Taurine catabolism dioxygenase n=1 Tax=Dacryopinax primogenitus (strain DJM 731) TaxID=1858805 RepID=M5G9V7_DACPD|nr:taurine catabolism dioxygenase [Dacryopinax primogenitus]EJU05599.1 taurine catabolism dioxygenase [Dacryopinax primogenitus]
MLASLRIPVLHGVRGMATSASLQGSLAALVSHDLTPHIGTRFPDPLVQLSKILADARSSEMVKDLATLVSHRGVVFFTKQDLDIQQQKQLVLKMGELTGRPETSGLHKHPVSEDSSELGADVSVISSIGGIARAGVDLTGRASNGWHSDISFENVPADFSVLKMHTLPAVGGDTLWASGYEAYDRLSPAYKKFLEGLTAVHDGNFFHETARAQNVPIQSLRGSPLNDGEDLRAVHPVVRTHPITGFKALFVNRSFTTRILELTKEESDHQLDYLFRHIAENHDLQGRYRWEKDDLAIWDNRVVLHTATNVYADVRPNAVYET